MPVDRIPYRNKYPSAAKLLMEDDITSTPRQYIRDLRRLLQTLEDTQIHFCY